MRYSEAILRLEKDPTLEFKLLEGTKTWTLKTDYDPMFPDEESLYFVLECDSAYHFGNLWSVVDLIGLPDYLAVVLKNGKWYVED